MKALATQKEWYRKLRASGLESALAWREAKRRAKTGKRPPAKVRVSRCSMSYRDPDDIDAYNAQLAKLMTRLKKDAGATTIRQNYRGTGSRKARRQLWIHFKSGAVIDVWLDEGFVKLGGVVTNRPPGSDVLLSQRRFTYGDMSPEQSYNQIVEILGPWANPSTSHTERDARRGPLRRIIRERVRARSKRR